MIENAAMYLLTTALGALIGLVGKIIVDSKTQREATKSLLRSEMVKAYYKYKDAGKMPHYAKEAWYLNYEEYKAWKGNSFIEDLKDEIDEWDIM